MGLFDKVKTSNDITKPETVIKTIQDAFGAANITFKFNQEANVFMVPFQGDDLPIPLGIAVSDVVLHFRANLALRANPQNYQKVLSEINGINKDLLYGSFSMDPEEGFIYFDYGFPYQEAKVSQGFFLSFLQMIVKTVDEHDGALKEIAEATPREEYEAMYR